MIGELDLISGSSDVSLGTVGYCSQDPWLRATGTVRENILFDKPYERAWYDEVLKATALAVDVRSFEEGDRRVVSGLSGGQKQRYVWRDAAPPDVASRWPAPSMASLTR